MYHIQGIMYMYLQVITTTRQQYSVLRRSVHPGNFAQYTQNGLGPLKQSLPQHEMIFTNCRFESSDHHMALDELGVGF